MQPNFRRVNDLPKQIRIPAVDADKTLVRGFRYFRSFLPKSMFLMIFLWAELHL